MNQQDWLVGENSKFEMEKSDDLSMKSGISSV